MSNYDKAIAFTLKWEGGYVNDPQDKGGETYRGISRKNNPNWKGWAVVDSLKPKTGDILPELEEHVKAYYKEKYWGRIGEITNPGLAAFLFDWNVNSGYHSVAALQRIIDSKDDGVLGNNTITKANAFKGEIVKELIAARRKFVSDIVRRQPTQNKYLKGWLNRIANFEASFGVKSTLDPSAS